jgi:hypothetical protein
MTDRLDLLQIAREEQDGDVFKLLDSIYKRSSTKPRDCRGPPARPSDRTPAGRRP